jgi:hypothetical protein
LEEKLKGRNDRKFIYLFNEDYTFANTHMVVLKHMVRFR